LFAVSLGTLVAAAMRVRGKGGVPPQSGGWKELQVSPPPSSDA
jgi:hypothetical protein